ncbi:hypothetical protein KSP40_PGU016105 [Platanthera guangdongensis]|uniref:Uncharacterized protein n=1 Tax=Platanthera guangdongensis TaxID=2320717 RepID=A0ABR2LJT9_9ASPA
MRKERDVESPEMPLEDSERSPPQFSVEAAETEEKDDEEFEFAFVARDCDTGTLITADEIFSNGEIRSFYPVFNRHLVLTGAEDRVEIVRQTQSSPLISPLSCSDDPLDGILPETYCVWKPESSEQCQKSASTGSLRRWRLCDLVVRRSQSDGKEKFVFVEKPAAPMAEVVKHKEKGKRTTEVDIATAGLRLHRRSGQGGTSKGSAAAAAGKSFLPYKPDILGLFTRVNGIRRVHHPF